MIPEAAPAAERRRADTALGAGPAMASPSDQARAALADVFARRAAGISSASAARAAVSRFGIVRSCEELRRRDGEPRLHMWVARGPYRMPGWRFVAPVAGTGVATEAEPARLAAVAESVERYASMAPVSTSILVRGAYRDLQDRAVVPSRFALLSQAQYERHPQLRPLGKDMAVDWCPMHSLTERRTALVPAALVHMSLVGPLPNRYVTHVTSTGTACHVSPEQALLAGLCEVLERDAVTIAWQNRLQMPRLDCSHTAAADLLDQVFAGCGLEISLHHVPTDAPFPVVLAVLFDGRSAPHAAAGAACRPDPEAAAVRAALEAAQVLSRLRSRPRSRPHGVRTFDDHAELYATRGGAQLLRRGLGDGSAVALRELGPPVRAESPADVEGILARAVRSLAARGLEVLVADLTPPDVSGIGYTVVRVLLPGMVDMSADARMPRLGGTRLYELPIALGARRTALGEGELNLMPVPLA